MTTVANIMPLSSYPHKIEGKVTLKGSIITIENVPYSIGSIRKATKQFMADSVIAYREGETGFVIYNESQAIAKIAGEIVSSNDPTKVVLKTDLGKVTLNSQNSCDFIMLAVAEDSKEVSEATRLSRSKVKKKVETTSSKKKGK